MKRQSQKSEDKKNTTVEELDDNGVVKSEPLTSQQKLWQRIVALIKAFRPLMLYLLLPAFLLAVARTMYGRNRTTEQFYRGSGNFYTVVSILICIYIFYRSAKKRKVTLWDDVTLSFQKSDLPKCFLMFGIGACIALGISAILTLIPLPEFLTTQYDDYSTILYKGTDVFLIIISQIAIAPLCEEIVFRGYMLNRLLHVFSERTSVIIVTLAFALCHINGIWVLYALVMGFLLTVISIKEDNILFSVALHVGFNFPSMIIYLINVNEKANALFFGSKLLIIAYGIIAMCGAVLLSRVYYKKENKIC